MAKILPQIEHIIVVMMENRSFDNMCGWLYGQGAQPPSQFLPAAPNPRPYDGFRAGLFNPVNEQYFAGQSKDIYPVFSQANATNMPSPDPNEDFPNVNYQLFGPEAPSQNSTWPNLGFVVNYKLVTGPNIPVQIMEPFSPPQVPVLSALAQNFGISDAWFSSVPSNTWPNRSFVHAGTSNGNVVNGTHPNPLEWDVPTIFNVMEETGVSWKVYSDTVITPPLTRLMFPKLWGLALDRFSHFDDFRQACASSSLPQYSFLEPSFLDNPNDDHPPHDVRAGEQFLFEIWQAVSQSPTWKNTLLVITYDEHGGTYDHVMPPWNASCPDAKSNPGQQGFTFNRFGVRVPAVVVSPWIQKGTVFRSDSAAGIPYDHTSILATLRDWLQIPSTKMLPSARIASAPTLAQVLGLQTPRTDLPNIPSPSGTTIATASTLLLNDLQKSLVTASAVQQRRDPMQALKAIVTRQDAIDSFTSPRSK
jgi:phospholipase C